MTNASAQLYHEAIKQLARAAHGAGRLQNADCHARADNPLCGDRIDIDVRREAGKIIEIGHKTRGCLLCEAAASAIGLRAPGRDQVDIVQAREELRKLLESDVPPAEIWPEFELFVPARGFPSRHNCLFLPFDALIEALT